MSKTICYTGIGAKKTGNHSEKEFMKAITKIQCKQNCPKDLNEWIKYSGADIISQKQCEKNMKKNKKLYDAAKVADKDTENLKKCINKKCENIINIIKDNLTNNNLAAIGVCASQRCQNEGDKLRKSNKKYVKLQK